MNGRVDRAGWRAAATAALLLVSGGVMGALVDRLWLSPPEAQATPLTAEAMATRLGLTSAEETHVRSLLDSLHAEILAVIEQAPDSLHLAVRDAQQRIEAALPPDARLDFRAWMQEHHERMMGRMHGGTWDHGETHDEASAGASGADRHPPP